MDTLQSSKPTFHTFFLDYTVHNTYREFSNCTLKFEWLLFTVKFILNPGV